MNQTAIFQALSQEIRLRALVLIASQGELCVCELVHALAAEQPKISRHLTAMKQANILTATRKAQWVYYAINKELEPWQTTIINAAITGAQTAEQIRKDRSRLDQMKNQQGNC